MNIKYSLLLCNTASEKKIVRVFEMENKEFAVSASGSTLLSPSEGKRLCYVLYIRYVISALWLTTADNGAWRTSRIQKWLARLNAAAVCYLRCNQSGRGGEMTNILHSFLSQVSARALVRPEGIKRKFALLSSALTACPLQGKTCLTNYSY